MAKRIKTKKVDVTIVITTHRTYKQFLYRSLQSALEQTMLPCNIIVIDDSPPDDSCMQVYDNVLKNYGQKGIDVRYYRLFSGNVQFSRNYALSKVETPYVVFLDADDYLDSRYVEMTYDLAYRHGFDVVYTQWYQENQGRKRLVATYDIKDFDLFKENCIGVTALVSVVSCREVGGFDEDINRLQDWALWVKMKLAGKRFRYVAYPGFVRRHHTMSHFSMIDGKRARAVIRARYLKEGYNMDQSQGRDTVDVAKSVTFVILENVGNRRQGTVKLTLDSIIACSAIDEYVASVIVACQGYPNFSMRQLDYKLPVSIMYVDSDVSMSRLRNLVLSRINTEYVCYLKAGVQVFPGWFREMMQGLQTHAIVGPVFADSYQGWQKVSEFVKAYPGMLPARDVFGAKYAELLLKINQGEFVTGNIFVDFACCMFKRKLVEKIGYHLETPQLGSMESAEFCDRVRLVGSVAVAVGVFVDFVPPSMVVEENQQQIMESITRLRVSRKQGKKESFVPCPQMNDTELTIVGGKGKKIIRALKGTNQHVSRILVQHHYGLGNAIMKVPALKALRKLYPGVVIAVWCDQDIAVDVFRLAGFDAFGKETVPQFDDYDMVVVLVPYSLGFKSEIEHKRVITLDVEDFKGESGVLRKQSEVDINFNIIKSMGYNGAKPSCSIDVPKSAIGAITALVVTDKPIIVFHNGSSPENRAYKRWDIEKLKKTIQWCRNSGFYTVLIGGEAEVDMRHIDVCDLNLVGMLSIPELFALMERAKLLVATDSGPVHVAASVGTPSVVLFGPAIYEKCRPEGKHIAVRKHLPCQPCWWTSHFFQCPEGQKGWCMRSITVEEVISAIKKMIPCEGKLSPFAVRPISTVTNLITTCRRPELLQGTLESIAMCPNEVDDYTLVVADDIDNDTYRVVKQFQRRGIVDEFVFFPKKRGISFVLNVGLEIAKFNGSPFINYIQDDIQVQQEGWLDIMLEIWDILHREYNVGCLTGVDYEITDWKKHLKEDFTTLILKGIDIGLRWHVSAKNMFMPREHWQRYFPIDYVNPVDGLRRGFPDHDRGSGVDWWITDESPQSLCALKQPVAVLKGLMFDRGQQAQHSTWRSIVKCEEHQDQYIPEEYWRERLSRWRFDLRGVGNKTMSHEANLRQYEQATRVFLALCEREHLLNRKKISVLDVGCGTGWYARVLRDRFQCGEIEYLGIDITDTLFPWLRREFESAGYRFAKQDVTVERFSGRKKYDLVIMIDVCQHIVDDRYFLFAMENVKRVLKKNGVFIVTSWCDASKRQSFYEKSRDRTTFERIFWGYKFSEPVPFRDKFIFAIRKG